MSQAAEIITALLGVGGLGSMFQLFRTSADVNKVKRSEVPSLDKRVDTLFEIVNGQNDAIDGLRDENKAMGIKLDDLRDALHITMDYAEAVDRTHQQRTPSASTSQACRLPERLEKDKWLVYTLLTTHLAARLFTAVHAERSG